MKKLYFLFLFSLTFRVLTQAPPTPAPLFPSPNAASLGIFSQYPQIPSTGLPAINIPVYNLNYQGLDLPIQLSYNTNLVKPYSLTGWVGQGWNLSAGGAIIWGLIF